MANKRDFIFELYHQTVGSITANENEWKSFLSSASRNFKLRFDEQVLVYAQKPDATAVLEFDRWNDVYGRWINKGAKGIAVFNSSIDRRQILKHYFDISDTHEIKGSRPVNIWEMKKEYEEAVTETLENSFGELSNKTSFQKAVLSASKNAVSDNISDYFEEMKKSIDTDYGEIEIEKLRDEFSEIATLSMAYMILSRLYPNNNTPISEGVFNSLNILANEDMMAHLGFAVSDITEIALREISSTVSSLEKENRRIEKENMAVHNEEKNITNETENTISDEISGIIDDAIDVEEESEFEERSDSNEADVQAAGRLSVSGSKDAGGKASGEIRPTESGVSKETHESDLHEPVIERRTGAAPTGNAGNSGDESKSEHETNGGKDGSNGIPQSKRPNEVAKAYEQHQAHSRRDSYEGTDLQLVPPDVIQKQLSFIEGAEENESSAFLITEEILDDVLRNGADDNSSITHIISYFKKNHSREENAEFLKKEYGRGGKGLIIGTQNISMWFDENGIRIAKGNTALNSTNAKVITWDNAANRINELLLSGMYASKELIDSADTHEISDIAKDLWYLHQDRDEGAKFDFIDEQFYFKAGFPESSKRIAKLLSEPAGRINIIEGLNKLSDAYENDPSIFRFNISSRTPKILARKISDLNAIPLTFPASTAVPGIEKGFLTDDEIDNVLTRGSGFSEGKYRIYSYFIEKHTPKEKAAFLKNEYGSGGSSWSWFSESHDSKGIELRRSSKLTLFDKRILSWANAQGRIDELIKAEKYMSEKEIAYIPEYEKRILEREESNTSLANEEESPVSETVEKTSFDKEEKEPFILTGKFYSLPETEKGQLSLFGKDATPTGYEHLLGEELEEAGRRYRIDSIFDGKAKLIDISPEENPDAPSVRIVYLGVANHWYERTKNWERMDSEKNEEVKTPEPEPESIQAQTNPIAEKQNYIINDDNLGEGNLRSKFEANIKAIELLNELDANGSLATITQQEILSGYTGWGALSSVFDEGKPEWSNEYKTLKELLSDEEYESARETTLTAYYTPPVIIKAMYKAIEKMGFSTGNILEPSCGIGNFMGLIPDNMKDSKVYGVELDSLTGRIAKQLYQKNDIAIKGFEETDFQDSFFDLAIGNIPFGNFGVVDKRYDKQGFLIHDYFFAKTLDKIRPGGVVALVTSKGTLDKKNPAVRKYIAERAELLGAIRLPNNTFTANAGTSVTADIIFLQKRDRIMEVEPDWVHLGLTETDIPVNSYFASNPDMILGDMSIESGMFGSESVCMPFPDSNLKEQLDYAISNIHARITEYERDEGDDEDNSIPADPNVRNFSFTIIDEQIYYRVNSKMIPSELSVTGANRVLGMIEIRDSARRLIEFQTENYPEEDIHAEQENLNNLYNTYTKKYGILNSRGNSMAFSEDSSYPLLCSLEVLDAEGNLLRKADMFSKRTIKPVIAVTSVDTASEALAVSIGEKAGVDIDFMQELTGLSEEEIERSLEGVIFKDVSDVRLEDIPKSQKDFEKIPFSTADEYLSGNVREKLQNVTVITETFPDTLEKLKPNIEALKKVVPKDLSASEISVRLGSTWIPPEYVNSFMYEILDTPSHAKRYVMVHYSEHTASWNVEGKNFDRGNIAANSTYGTSRISAYKIIEESLNLRDVRVFDVVYDDDGNKTSVLNKKETTLVRAKQEQIKDAFSKWLFNEPERREKIVRIYNNIFNSMRTREYDGSHITFSGINPEIELYEHQKNAIARILYGGNTLLAHVVGAGKTFTMTAAAMESKRLGLCSKSLFVVPNHLTEQWASEFLQLYPSANLLVATKKDFEMKNRRKFCSRISTGDYDAVIIGHSQLEKIPISQERQERLLRDQIEDIQFGINDLKRQNGERFSIKQMEKTKKMLKSKLKKLTDQEKKDSVVTFEELGIDRLFVDEAHYYKNLFLYTKMRNVGGISQVEAQKSSDLFMKCRYIDEITDSKGTTFATGTPISNSMVELYTMQRYLQYDLLSKHNLQHFDSWASTFGETVSAIELAPEGTGYRMKTRFAKFFNLPELMTMFKQSADIKTSDMLNLPVPKANFHNIAIPPSDVQKEMVLSLSERAEKVRAKVVAPNIDNMLLITNDGRKLALDERLINDMLPANDNGKVAVCADNVYRIWNDSKEKRLTQLVFCDLSTPKNNDKFNIYDEMKKRLLERGVPESEIAFIHSAGTDSKKKELFAKIRTGSVRILLGSTAKMGAGTNVQDLLIASHDLDCPWRPSDLEQRAGRTIRQGNSNLEVDLYRYVTEQTFDAYLYQIIENKQKFIGQIMTSKSPVRTADDIDETALSYAEIKALATGNPYIKEKMDLDIEVAKLKVLRAGFFEQKYNLEDKIVKAFPAQIEHQIEKIKGYELDIAHLKENTNPNKEEFSPMIIDGISYSERMEAGKALITACSTIKSSDSFHIGSYRGFKMDISFNAFDKVYVLKLKNNLSHKVELGADISGNITRINNVLDGMGKKLSDSKEILAHSKQQLENAKAEVEKSFPQEEELSTKAERLTELNELLSMDEKDLSATELDEESPEQDSAERSYER